MRRAVVVVAALLAGCATARLDTSLDQTLKICGRPLSSLGFGHRRASAAALKADRRSVAVLTTACAGGDKTACLIAGQRLADGQGVARDRDKAREVYQRGCDLGELRACGDLGGLYATGYGPDDRNERALAMFRFTCKRGDCTNLVVAYAYGCASQLSDEDRALVTTACDHGDHDTCSNLGMLYQQGLGVPHDDARAQGLFTRGCDHGDTVSCANLATLYRHADGRHGVEPDDARAAALFTRACEHGNPVACGGLAEQYLDGKGVAKDERKAFALWDDSCKRDVPTSCLAAALLVRDGRGATADPARAIQLLRRACTLGSAEACDRVGIHNYKGDRDKSKAVAAFRASCDQQYVDGCYNLGVLLRDGDGVGRDDARARALFEQACTAGHMTACGALGDLLLLGRGGAADVPRGYAVARRACEGKLYKVCGPVGEALLAGRVIPKDAALGEKLLRLGCDHGEESVCIILAVALLTSPDGPRDAEHAVALLDQACDHGDASGCFNAGAVYREGIGVSRDEARAYGLHEKACKGGDLRGCTNQAYLLQLGVGVARDWTRAIALFDLGCQKDVAFACKGLAAMHFVGQGTMIDFSRAEVLLARACKLGDEGSCKLVPLAQARIAEFGATPSWDAGCAAGKSDACERLFTLRCTDEESQRRSGAACVELANQRCAASDEEGCMRLGVLYLQGYAIDKDVERGVRVLTAACEHKHAHACFNLGIVAQSGMRGGVADEVAALARFRQACDGKDGEGCLGEGMVLRKRNNDAPARVAFGRGCDVHNIRCCAFLGTMLLGGEGGPKDLARAARLLDDACRSGEQSACAVRDGAPELAPYLAPSPR